MLKSLLLSSAVSMLALCYNVSTANACGGFFCGQAPVDQSAEQIVFSVDEDANQTTMVVQIAYEGDSDDFSWIVPIADVPVEGSLDTFPQTAMAFIEQSTRRRIVPDYATCNRQFSPSGCGGGGCADAGVANADAGGGNGGVNVLVQEAVGPFDTVVISSDDTGALVAWLRDNGYRVTNSMIPYLELYTSQGLNFLALKLQPQRKVSEIVPFKMTLPGTSPSIPLKMTGLAALPEMGIIVSVFGGSRYQGANWPNVDLDLADIKFRGGQSNYVDAVAKAIDKEGGQGWVTELARSSDDLKQNVEFAFFGELDQVAEDETRAKLVELIGETPYFTRLYARLSPEEMTSDPVLRRSTLGDVSSLLNVPVDADCNTGGTATACEMTTCGAGGLCKSVQQCDGSGENCFDTTGCSCVPGTAARVFPGPFGQLVVACQDQQMSFLNPGDIEVPDATPLPDACIGHDCGPGGTCVNINLSPSCVCDTGYVATATTGSVTCVKPETRVTESFFSQRLPARPSELPAGRTEIVMPKETPEAELAPLTRPADPGVPVSGCSVSPANASGGLSMLALFGLVGVAMRRRR